MQSTIYVLGYWGNPYRSGNEYFWFRGEDGMKDAKAMANRKQERGQPRQFTNWVKGKNRFFTCAKKFQAAALKVGLNPALEDWELEETAV